MTTGLSQLQEAVNDTLLHRAEGLAFDALVAQFGFSRPHYIERWAWRRACLAGVFGRAGTFGCLHAFLEGALAQYSTRFDATLNPANPQRVTAPAGTFAARDASRLMRIPGVGLFRIASYTSSSVVELLPFRTAYWDRADWSTYDVAVTVEDAEILPFEVHEPTATLEDVGVTSANGIRADEPALVRVMLYSEVLSPTPPTYMQDENATRTAGQPLGGHVQEDAAEAGDQVSGPFPIYLVGTTALRDVAEVASRMLLPAGFRLEFRRTTFG